MPSQPRNGLMKERARELRRNMTPEERRMWFDYLRPHPVWRFRRQEIIGPYIADFYCAQAKLVIEIDGSQHYEENAAAHDEARTAYLQLQGLRVIRFTNADIHQRFEGVCQMTEQALAASAHKE